MKSSPLRSTLLAIFLGCSSSEDSLVDSSAASQGGQAGVSPAGQGGTGGMAGIAGMAGSLAGNAGSGGLDSGGTSNQGGAFSAGGNGGNSSGVGGASAGVGGETQGGNAGVSGGEGGMNSSGEGGTVGGGAFAGGTPNGGDGGMGGTGEGGGSVQGGGGQEAGNGGSAGTEVCQPTEPPDVFPLLEEHEAPGCTLLLDGQCDTQNPAQHCCDVTGFEVDPVLKCKRRSLDNYSTWGCYALYACQPGCASSLVPVCLTRQDMQGNIHYFRFYENPWFEEFKQQFGFEENCNGALSDFSSEDIEKLPLCPEN